MQGRPTFDDVYMNLAMMLAKRSTCLRASVGCVVASEDGQRVLSVGYNGNYRGGANCCDSSEPGACGCLHAEDNALIKLDFNDPVEKILYTTTSPCLMCAKRIINSGITKVRYLNAYRKTEGIELLQKAGVEIWKVPDRKIQVDQDGEG